jgi:histidine triad (HIT) family protein
MTMGCIFCKIVKGEIPCTKVYEDEMVLAFEDIQPMSKVHTLVVPKAHVGNLNSEITKDLWYAILKAVQEIVRVKGISESGYRLAINSGPDGTQIVPHLHVHVLGGQMLDAKLG